MIVRRNLELYHHGIKGQRWGVKNGPPYPLGSDESTGERLKAQKEVRGLVNKKYNNFDQATKDVAWKLSKKIRKEDIDNLLKLKDEWYNASAPDFYESAEAEEAYVKAYEETTKWFEKNEPEKLSEWKKQTDDLTDFHDFRKICEGYEDEYYDKYREKFEERMKKQNKHSEDWYFERYTQSIKKYVDDLIGEVSYSSFAPQTGANRIIKFTQKGQMGAYANNATVHDVIYWAIDELEKNGGMYFYEDGSVRLKR